MILLTKKEVAKILRATVKHVEHLMKCERIEFIRFGKRMVRFSEKALQDYIKKHTTPEFIQPTALDRIMRRSSSRS